MRQNLIIGIISLIVFVLLYISLTTKTEKQKAWDRKQKKKRLEEENRRKTNESRRLAIIRSNKEAERQRKMLIKRQHQEKLDQAREQIGKKVSEVFTTTSKLISDSTHKIKSNIELKISKHYLTSFSWVMVNASKDHILFTFRSNNELIITKNGNVEKGSYEVLGQNQSILITRDGSTKHFNFVNLNNDYFFLNKVSTFDVHAFVNQKNFTDQSKQWFLNEVKKVKEGLEIQ